jgi:endonuclease-3
MQTLFDFDPSPRLPRLRESLRAAFGPQVSQARLDPVSQMIKSLISARTYDSVSAAAFANLRRAFPDWAALKEAEPARIEALLGETTFADQKARQLPVLLKVVDHRAGGLDLGFLADWPVEQATAWLEALPGVGAHTAAAVLNFSTLNKRAMVVDGHVNRVARRLALVGRSSEPGQTGRSLMAMASSDWSAETVFELHWLLKGLGQAICTDTPPACGRCPLKADCPRVDVGIGRKVIPFAEAKRMARLRG